MEGFLSPYWSQIRTFQWWPNIHGIRYFSLQPYFITLSPSFRQATKGTLQHSFLLQEHVTHSWVFATLVLSKWVFLSNGPPYQNVPPKRLSLTTGHKLFSCRSPNTMSPLFCFLMAFSTTWNDLTLSLTCLFFLTFSKMLRTSTGLPP